MFVQSVVKYGYTQHWHILVGSLLVPLVDLPEITALFILFLCCKIVENLQNFKNNSPYKIIINGKLLFGLHSIVNSLLTHNH